MRFLLLSIGMIFHLLTLNASEPLHVVILGDSNTWIGGDDCNQAQGWNKWFCDALQPTTCRSYARSGATWTNTVQTKRNTQENIGVLGHDNVIFNQVCRLQEAVDSGVQPRPQLIIIMAGTNDLWFGKDRPMALKTDASQAFQCADSVLAVRPVSQVLTLAESIRYAGVLLHRLFPQAHLVLMTPMQSTTIADGQLDKAAGIMAECGERLGASVIRLDREGCVRRAEEVKSRRLTRDGIHTNEKGAQCIGNYVAEEVRRMRTDGIF